MTPETTKGGSSVVVEGGTLEMVSAFLMSETPSKDLAKICQTIRSFMNLWQTGDNDRITLAILQN